MNVDGNDEKEVNDIKIEEITLTFICVGYPKSLEKLLKSNGKSVEKFYLKMGDFSTEILGRETTVLRELKSLIA
ncbi:hypothetical protein [Thermoanaerobacterium sp. RBIITD]|uniref:hypothetical protein n=1 Tax=Thermoanaerobacterium sp. RBIITD TaxID=1550240 RepID=UPI000BB715F0|nr:hypothetical protein [Thermoanaerobacterium sp. RBIITD]